MWIVTGGAGFIGSNVVAALEQRGDAPVVVCDRLRRGGKWKNVAKRGLADLVHPDDLFEYLQRTHADVRGVIHMGAITATTETDADLTVAVNVHLSKRLWTWCAERRVPFIYASSAATYGDGALGFEDDADPAALARLRPMNVYGWSKHVFDRWVMDRVRAGAARPPQWAGLKFFNVYGPNEYHKGEQASVVSKFYPTVRDGQPVRLFKSHRPDYPDGGQRRDFVWVGDCVDVVMWLLDTPAVSGLFNCGTGAARTFDDLAAAVFRALGREPDITYTPMPEDIREHYQYFTEASLRRLRAAGYTRPFTSLEDGVGAYVNDYLHTPDPYR